VVIERLWRRHTLTCAEPWRQGGCRAFWSAKKHRHTIPNFGIARIRKPRSWIQRLQARAWLASGFENVRCCEYTELSI